MKVEFLKAEILSICKTNVVMHTCGWDVTWVMTGMSHPGNGSINRTDFQSI